MNSIKTLFLTAAICLSSIAVISEAGSLQGEDAPEFQGAVRAWLDGDDLRALQDLSEQAQQGNAAAQILLASIASRSSFHSHVTADMDRKERIELLRKSGGLSGKTWLTEAQNSEPLALALLQASRIGEKAPAIAALVELGEPQTAMIAAQSMLLNGKAGELISVLQGLDGKLPKEADVLLVWALFQASQGSANRYAGSARVAGTLSGDERFLESELAWGAFTPRELVENSDVREAATRLSGEIEAWTPIRNFCSEHCSGEVSVCTATGATLLSSPFTPRSPLQGLISNERYWASERIEGDVVRSIVDLRQWNSDLGVTYNHCFMSNMQKLQHQHLP
ncbi:hypothetical protein [uncultured Ruegeria sp.]|uniref:hypothetical protein n=1 Tax=uncultured Ruegeria sp. TaxID=259304 RepID=UPI0026324342|nr:hypothetical protein [uncultured Ruegeria sp.]